MLEEQFSKAQTKQETQAALGEIGRRLCGPAIDSNRPTVKEILTRRADDLRAEALALEALARQYPEHAMTSDVETTLRRLLTGNLYR